MVLFRIGWIMGCGSALGKIFGCCLGGDKDDYCCLTWTCCCCCLRGEQDDCYLDNNDDRIFKIIGEDELSYILLLLGIVLSLFK